MKIIFAILNWFFGLLFGLLGISMIATGEALSSASAIFLISFLLLPPIRSLFFKISKKSLPVTYRALTIFVLFVLFVVFGWSVAANEDAVEAKRLERSQTSSLDYFNSNREDVLSTISDALSVSDFDQAMTEIDKYILVTDSAFLELAAEAKLAKKADEAAQQQARKQARTESLLGKLKTVPESSFQENIDLYKQLADLYPDNNRYKEKIAFYNQKLTERLAAEKEAERIRLAAEKEAERIAAQSPEDKALENVILKSTWDKTGFGSVMLANFEITNSSFYVIKDIEVTCILYAKSGTSLGKNTKIIYDIIPRNSKKDFKEVNMGFMHTQVEYAGCYITELKVE